MAVGWLPCGDLWPQWCLCVCVCHSSLKVNYICMRMVTSSFLGEDLENCFTRVG